MSLRFLFGFLAFCSYLLWAAPLSAQIVAPGAVWSYLDDGSDQGTAWQAPSFNDAAWATGNAQLGYGDGDEATVVSYGVDPDNKHITTYFRHSFQVTNPAAITALQLHLIIDDGAIVYLNGAEVVRINMPVTWDYLTESRYAASRGENEWSTFFLPAPALLAGTNVLAVEVHQSDPDSSDLSFDLELEDVTGVPILRGPYLQMAGADQMTLRWRTPEPTDSLVQIGAAPGALTTSFHDAALTTDHAVTVTGLSPDTVYFYSVGETGNVRAGDDTAHWFRSSDAVGAPTSKRIWLLGDAGTNDANQEAVRDAFLNYSTAAPADLILLLGDNAYDAGSDGDYQTAIFDMYAESLRTTPLFSTRGNHEFHTVAYYDIFTKPTAAELGGVASGTEAYYSFDYGKIHFVCLDSQGSSRLAGGPMATWLEADLASTLQPWIIAFWHHPPYTKGSHDSDTSGQLTAMREVFVPILEDYGVDLVFNGHSHSYERSFLIDGHYGLSTTWDALLHQLDGGDGSESGDGAYSKLSGAHQGAVFTVAGSSGKTSDGPFDHPAMYTSQERLGSVILDVNDYRIDVAFLDDLGVVRDEYTVLRDAPPILTVSNLIAGAQASFSVTETLPGNQVILGASLVGGGPTATIYGTMALSPPVQQLGSGASDATGTYTISATVPFGLAGTTVWFQAIEITAPSVGEFTNALMETVP